MNILKKEIVINCLDVIVTVSYIKGHEDSYAVEKMVQIYNGNVYVSYDEEALEDVINFMGIEMLDRFVKEQIKEVA